MGGYAPLHVFPTSNINVSSHGIPEGPVEKQYRAVLTSSKNPATAQQYVTFRTASHLP